MTQTEVGTAVAERREATEIEHPADHEHSALVRLALEKNVGVETIERLVALQERMAERDARGEFFRALGRFQSECPPCPKTKTAKIVTKKGGSYSYPYAPLDALVAHVRPYLHKHGFSTTWDCEANDTHVRATCYLKHVEGHAESASFSAPTETDAAMSGAQKNGAALTFAQRRSFEQVTGIVTTEDTDAAAPAMLEAITEEQLADLEALADEVGADRKKFCAWLKVPSMADIPVAQYETARNALEAKR